MENNHSVVKAGLVLALAIAGFFGFLYFQEKQQVEEKSKEIELKTAEIIHTNFRLDSIARELDIKMSELAALGGRIEELEEIKANLEKDKRNLIQAHTVDMQEYQEKIKYYEQVIRTKEAEITKLKADNVHLTGVNQELNRTNVLLKDSNAALAKEKVALADTVNLYAATNRDLNEKVTIGAALRPVNYLVTAINRKGKERDGDEFKSKRVDRIKVSFKLAENPLTRREAKTIYMRLLEPTGNVIADMALGSGSFLFGGKETVYTTKQTIQYTNSNQAVDFIYDRDKKYEKGQYKVELYAEGFRVGQTTFVIK
jgi:Tfp pilus assembly protein PilN